MSNVAKFERSEKIIGAPHDLPAEMGLLGAILYENANLDTITDILVPEAFHEPLHGRIYAAVSSLIGIGRRADRITVAHALGEDQGLLDAGGPDYLADLVELTTAMHSCLDYATIIAELWRRREIIRLCESAAKQARGGEQSGALIEAAERDLMALQLSTRTIQLVDAADAIDRVTYQLDNPATSFGVRMGLEPIDDVTGGMMPGEMWLVAGRPGMGKSAVSSSTALHVARHGISPEGKRLGVIEICCEMTVEQMMRRHISDLAYEMFGRDAPSYSTIRKRAMGSRQREMFNTAAAEIRQLGTLKSIYRTGLNVTAIRSVVRRQKVLWHRQGIKLGLVIVDHVGLIRGSAHIRNRHEAQGEVAREMKELPGEFEAPVLALVQLNRKVEERDDRRPMLSDLRDCVTGDTLVALADGRQVSIADLVGSNPLVVTPDAEFATASAIWSVGPREVFDVRLRSGRRIRCTARHRLLGARGWARLEELTVGSRIAVMRELPAPADPDAWPDVLVAFLGQMIGDGSYTHGSSPSYVSGSPDNIAAVEAGAAHFGATVHRYITARKTHLSLACGGNRWKKGALIEWFDTLGIRDQRSGIKRVPEPIFRLANHQIALLLRHLWATDGHIGDRAVSYTTKSPGLAQDVGFLLQRLGVLARLSLVPSDNCYRVTVRDGDVALFAERVGAFGPRILPLQRLMDRGIVHNTNIDTLPVEFVQDVRTVLAERRVSHRRFAALRSVRFNGAAQWKGAWGWVRAAEAAEILDDERLHRWVAQRYFWDEVAAITSCGDEEVFDIAVPGPNAWVANGIVSHNSGEWEENADGVIGVYREAYYAQREPEPKRHDLKQLWEERRSSVMVDAILMKIREGKMQTVKLWTDMGRNAIRGHAPENSFDYRAPMVDLLDPDAPLPASSPTDFSRFDPSEFS